MKIFRAVLFLLLVLPLAGCFEDTSDSLVITFDIVDYSFLGPSEVGVNVWIENPTETVMVISNLSSQPGAGANDGIALLGMGFRDKNGNEADLRIERRNSEISRYRNSIKEGGLFIQITEIDAIYPGQAVFYQLIASHPDRVDMKSGGLFQARFDGPVRNSKRTSDEMDTVETIFGPQIDTDKLRKLKFRKRQFMSLWHDGKKHR